MSDDPIDSVTLNSDGDVILALPREPLSKVDIDVERERRRYLPIAITTDPSGRFGVNMDATSQANIQGLATVGLYLQSVDPTQTTVFRDYDNVIRNLLPTELIAMGLQVAAYVGNVYAKSWALKAMDTIPSDYVDDRYWQ